MNLEKLVKRKTVEYNELVISREMLIELIRSQHIGVSDDVKVEFIGVGKMYRSVVSTSPDITIKMTWERGTGDG